MSYQKNDQWNPELHQGKKEMHKWTDMKAMLENGKEKKAFKKKFCSKQKYSWTLYYLKTKLIQTA